MMTGGDHMCISEVRGGRSKWNGEPPYREIDFGFAFVRAVRAGEAKLRGRARGKSPVAEARLDQMIPLRRPVPRGVPPVSRVRRDFLFGVPGGVPRRFSRSRAAANRNVNRHANRHANPHANRHANRQCKSKMQIDMQIDMQIEMQIDMQIEMQIEMQIDMQIDNANRKCKSTC